MASTRQALDRLALLHHQPMMQRRHQHTPHATVVAAIGEEKRVSPHYRLVIIIKRAALVRLRRELKDLAHGIGVAEQHRRPERAKLDRERVAVPGGTRFEELNRLLNPQLGYPPARQAWPRGQTCERRERGCSLQGLCACQIEMPFSN